jgi:hypothetical protein
VRRRWGIRTGEAFGVCFEKESELPKSDERRRCKYQIAFRGKAREACDAYGNLFDRGVTQVEFEQACAQADLQGDATWIASLEEVWPEERQGKWRRPVVSCGRLLMGTQTVVRCVLGKAL